MQSALSSVLVTAFAPGLTRMAPAAARMATPRMMLDTGIVADRAVETVSSPLFAALAKSEGDELVRARAPPACHRGAQPFIDFATARPFPAAPFFSSSILLFLIHAHRLCLHLPARRQLADFFGVFPVLFTAVAVGLFALQYISAIFTKD